MADGIVIVRGGPRSLGAAMRLTLRNLQVAMQQAAIETARWGVARMIRETAMRRVDASTHFKGQWKVIKLQNGAATANTAPYARFVEAGRGPGRMPPVKAIEKWILAKGIRPKKPPTVSRADAMRAATKGRRVTGEVTSGKQRRRIRANIRLYAKIYKSKAARTLRHADMLKGLALGIAKGIGQKGTKPKWLLHNCLDEFKRQANRNYEAAVRRVARDPMTRPRGPVLRDVKWAPS